jgi:hypothetical protein
MSLYIELCRTGRPVLVPYIRGQTAFIFKQISRCELNNNIVVGDSIDNRII